MLVLSRKIGEKIVIGKGVVVTVLEVKGRQVRLGIEAPLDVPIWRGELAPSRQSFEADVDHCELVGV